MGERLEVRDGTVLTIDVLRWDEGWEFDCPVCVLRPVIRFSPNGDSAEQMVEDLCLDACVDGFLESEPLEDGLIDRQYAFKALKRRWNQAHGGKVFPVRHYTASRFHVRFYSDADGLAFDVAPLSEPTREET